MKGSERFKQRIQTYLEELSEVDERFAAKFWNPKKNIDDCITYILNCVRQSECAGFDDDEIFSMAVHYFDEEDIDIGKPLQCDVRIDHVVELTEEEKAQARQAAMQRAEREAYANLMQPKKKKPATQPEPAEKVEQASLFLHESENETSAACLLLEPASRADLGETERMGLPALL